MYKKIPFKGLIKQNWGKLGLELLVVFLGVTAGFVLNNWRDDRRDAELEHLYLTGFMADVEANLEELERFNLTDSLWLRSNAARLKEMQQSLISKDSSEALFRKIIYFSKMEAHTGTYTDITNSGNLNLIRDHGLKADIVGYHLKVKEVGFVDDYFYNYFNTYVTPFVFDNFDILNAEFKDENTHQSLKFKNVIVGYYSTLVQRNAAYKELIDESASLEQALSRALKN